MDILSVDVTPLASGAHATSCLDMSVAASKSVDLRTSMSSILMIELEKSKILPRPHLSTPLAPIIRNSEILHM